MHYISSIEIKNFRSCQNVRVELSPFTPLVGYNNAGKSNILSAIQWLIKKETFKEKDFFNKLNSVDVIGVIENISDNLLNQLDVKHKKAIENFVNANNQLKIQRIQSKPDASASDFEFNLWDWNEGNWQKSPTNTDKALSALFPEPIHVGAMENATEDSSKAKNTTTIGKLLAEFVKPIKEKHEVTLKNKLQEITKLISADGEDRISELNDFDKAINTKIQDFFPDISLKIDINTPSFDDIFKDGTIRVYENNNEGRDCSAYGHGAQRSIQMALIRHLADIKTNSSSSLSTTLLLIDEPELYLHPFAIEQLREALKALSKSSYQVLFSTHSPQMIISDDAQNTLLVHKENHATKIRKRLHDAIQVIVPKSEHQEELLFSLSHSSKILFSENVVLTEGKTELRLLPLVFQKITNRTLGQEKIALIPQGGVDNTQKSMAVLQAMDLPVKAIVDLDYIRQLNRYDWFINSLDEVEKIKSIFQRLANENKISLDLETKFPNKGNNVSASKAFEILAEQTDAQESIKNIHNICKENNIWIWKTGAIEKHLGLTGKDESVWSSFKIKIESEGIENSCADYAEIKELIDWLRAE